MIKRLIFIFIFLLSFSIFGQGNSRYKLEMDPNSGAIKCYLQNEQRQQTNMDLCLTSNTDSLEFYFDEHGNCNAFMKDGPNYFVDQVDNKNCNQSDPIRPTISYQENLVMNANENRRHLCESLKICMDTINEELGSLVNILINVLRGVNIDAHYSALKNSVNDSDFESNLEAFDEALNLLEQLNNSCVSQNIFTDEMIEQARTHLSADIAEHSEVLDNDVYVYHWYKGIASKAVTTSDGNHNILSMSYARFLQSRYFSSDDEFGTGMQGRGFYASPGPRATSSYGDILLRIKLPEGSRYLDLEDVGLPGAYSHNPSSIRIRKETLEALRSAGCDINFRNNADVSPTSDLSSFYVNKAVFSGLPGCRDIFNDVIKQGGYVFQSYRYHEINNGICENSINTAFVLIDADFNSDTLTAFNDPFAEASENKLIHDLASISYDQRSNTDASIYFDNEPSEQEIERLRQEYQDQFWDCQ